MNENVKVIAPEDCGNAPKKIILRDVTIAFAKKDVEFILDWLAEEVEWTIIGKKSLQGKEDVTEALDQMTNTTIKELQIKNIITHGKTAALDGLLITAETTTHFCNVYHFTSGSRNAKLKEISTYVIETS